jgi:hypothetical protein
MSRAKYLFLHVAIVWAFTSAFNVSAAPANNPPVLRRNVALNATVGQLLAITSTNLFADDVETVDPVEIIYTYAPGVTNQAVAAGTVLLNNIALTAGKTFTQADINLLRLGYRAPTQLNLPSDTFTFSVRDADGALASDRGFTNFSFRVLFPNVPPRALNGTASCPLGGMTKGQFTAENSESLQGVTFRITEQGLLGTATLTNVNTGEFTYQARTPGLAGTDVIKFQVNDGTHDSATNGLFTIVIQNHRPSVIAQTITAAANQTSSGTIRTSDPDQPPQPMQFRATKLPLKGTLLLDPRTGAFAYTPNPGRFGSDVISIAASDFDLESAPVDFEVAISATPQDGDILLAGEIKGASKQVGGIYLVNPNNGDLATLYEEDFLNDAASMEYDPVRREAFVGVNTSQGKAFIGAFGIGKESVRLVAGMGDGKIRMPLGLDLDNNGQLLVADGPGGAFRLNPDTGEILERFQGGSIVAPLGIASDPLNHVILLDSVNFFEDDSRIIRINAADKSQTLLTADAAILDPADILFLPNGHYLICGRGGLFDFSPADAKLTTLIGTNNPLVTLLKEMVLDDDGFLYIGDMTSGLLKVDTNNWSVTRIALDKNVSPLGVAAFTIPRTLAVWQRSIFKKEDLADPAKETSIWGNLADADGDGASNLYEYALGLDPLNSADAKSGFAISFNAQNNQKYLQFSFPQRVSDPSVTYTPQASVDLRNWNVDAAQFALVKTEMIGPTFSRVTYQFSEPVEGVRARFFRLKIEKPSG